MLPYHEIYLLGLDIIRCKVVPASGRDGMKVAISLERLEKSITADQGRG